MIIFFWGMKMINTYILSDYIQNAIDYAEFEKLEDDTYCGRIPFCKGVIAFGATLSETNKLLRSTLEDWVLLGLKFRHELPIIDGIDLNINISEELYETV